MVRSGAHARADRHDPHGTDTECAVSELHSPGDRHGVSADRPSRTAPGKHRLPGRLCHRHPPHVLHYRVDDTGYDDLCGCADRDNSRSGADGGQSGDGASTGGLPVERPEGAAAEGRL